MLSSYRKYPTEEASKRKQIQPKLPDLSAVHQPRVVQVNISLPVLQFPTFCSSAVTQDIKLLFDASPQSPRIAGLKAAQSHCLHSTDAALGLQHQRGTRVTIAISSCIIWQEYYTGLLALV